MLSTENIIALATASGTGAIAILRVSGPDAISISNELFKSIRNKELRNQKSHTIHLGHIMDRETTLDEVLVSLFRSPNSYTGEDVVEISCHGSHYIQQQIMQLFLRKGCRLADPGEFTLRAFLNGKMDLSQAEAVADLIASDSAASHEMALKQMRGGFGNEIQALRQELLNFASLIELELDFSQEDVEFADRAAFEKLLNQISTVLKGLIDSFALGNVLKNGVPVAIVGSPNVGKSTLLNALLNEEKAIVSSIAGTTRDAIEDQISIKGVLFRFIDTAGIRETKDTVEQIGIERAYAKMDEAQIVIHLIQAGTSSTKEIEAIQNRFPNKPCVVVANKIDELDIQQEVRFINTHPEVLPMSAKQNKGVEELKLKLYKQVIKNTAVTADQTVVSNGRHYGALSGALEEIQKVKFGLDKGISGDLLAVDIRQSLQYLGEITGEISSDELLGNIFSNFCIGK